MKKFILTLFLFIALLQGTTFAVIPKIETVALQFESVTVSNGGISQIVLRDATRNILITFDYYDILRNLNKYEGYTYQYSYVHDVLIIKSGKTVVYDDREI